VVDSYLENYREVPRRRYSSHPAYRLEGNYLPLGTGQVLHGYVNTNELKKVCHGYGVSITKYLAAVLVWSIWQEYLDVKVIAKEQVRQVLSVFKQQKTGVFLYTFLQNRISIFYNRPEMTRQTQYYSDKALKACKRVALCQDLESAAEQEDVVYLACTGSKEDLEPIKAAAEQIPGVRCAFYLNIYNGQYCLEIFSGKAAKSNALLALKRRLGCSEAVVFGDNLNDLSMIQAADRSYAVANALEEVKGRATDVIGSCDEDGVAKFIHREVFGC